MADGDGSPRGRPCRTSNTKHNRSCEYLCERKPARTNIGHASVPTLWFHTFTLLYLVVLLKIDVDVDSLSLPVVVCSQCPLAPITHHMHGWLEQPVVTHCNTSRSHRFSGLDVTSVITAGGYWPRQSCRPNGVDGCTHRATGRRTRSQDSQLLCTRSSAAARPCESDDAAACPQWCTVPCL